MGAIDQSPESAGGLLRQWRHRRRWSQLELAVAADTSARHLSFVETGRAAASRAMLMRLADQLELPLRERNRLLLAAGLAPVYPETSLEAPALGSVRAAVRQLLAGHQPYPAVVVDRAWTLLEANDSVAVLTSGVAGELLVPPVNVLRLALHPDGMASRIANLGQWREHLLARLGRQVATTADPALGDLYEELCAYPAPAASTEAMIPGPGDIAVPLRLRCNEHELAFLSTVSTFGAPLDVTVAELAIESFLPADTGTATFLTNRMANPEGHMIRTDSAPQASC